MPLDLTLFPLHRINGQEGISMPGLLAVLPPRKAARGREQDRLIVYQETVNKAVAMLSAIEMAETNS